MPDASNAMPGPIPTKPPAGLSPTLFSLHGHGVRLVVDHPVVARPACRILAKLVEDVLPFDPIDGEIVDFVHKDVMRHVDDDAIAVRPGDPEHHPLFELFRSPAGDRWWHVDERWGLSEIDLVRGRWRSFVLPAPGIDAVRLFEATVWWPMAQILRGRGLHLVPAASMCDDAGNGTLLLSGSDPAPEVAAAGRNGWRIVGQRWTALREWNDGVEMLAVPGLTATSIGGRPLTLQSSGHWYDASVGAAGRRQATCKTVLLAEPARRPRSWACDMDATEARLSLRQNWPMPPIGSMFNRMPTRLAASADVYRVRLDRSGDGILDLLPPRETDRLAA